VNHVWVVILLVAFPIAVARNKAKEDDEWERWAVGAVVAAFVLVVLSAPNDATVTEAFQGCTRAHGTIEHMILECDAETSVGRFGIAPVLAWGFVGFVAGEIWNRARKALREPQPVVVALAPAAPVSSPQPVQLPFIQLLTDEAVLDALGKAVELQSGGRRPCVSSRDVATVVAQTAARSDLSAADVRVVGQRLARLARSGRLTRVDGAGRSPLWKPKRSRSR